jgi:hypothetical protein
MAWESFLIEASGCANSGVSYCISSKASMEFDEVSRSIHFPAFVFLGLFPHPVEINVSANEERVVSVVDAALSKITRKLRGVQNHLKNHVHSSFNPKVVSRYRPAVNLVTQIRSRPAAFYQLGLVHKIGASVPYRQSGGGTGRFGHKDALANRTNGRSWKKIRSNSRRLERQLARFFRSMWRRGGYALGP